MILLSAVVALITTLSPYGVSSLRLKENVLKISLSRSPIQVNNGLARTPPMGWNSWNYFGCDINETVIRETAEAIVSTGLKDAGYIYLNLDDCWAESSRNQQGRLEARNSTFPSGMKPLSDFIHGLGLKFGIYSDSGYLTCALQPGSLGFEETDAETFALWGVDYLKYDNCYNDGSLPQLRYARMRDAINKTGRPIVYSICNWGEFIPALWASDISNSWRTTLDIEDSWHSMIEIAAINNEYFEYAGPGGWNDPDMLEVGNGGMTESEYRVHFSLWALMKAPLLIGCDVRNLSKEAADILLNKEVIAINQDPLGLQGHRVRKSGYTEVWVSELASSRYVVGLLNRDEAQAREVTVRWSDMPFESGVVVKARDVWKYEDREGELSADFVEIVPPRDIVLLLLTKLN